VASGGKRAGVTHGLFLGFMLLLLLLQCSSCFCFCYCSCSSTATTRPPPQQQQCNSNNCRQQGKNILTYLLAVKTVKATATTANNKHNNKRTPPK